MSTNQNKESKTFYKGDDGKWRQRTSSEVTGEITASGLKNGGKVSVIELTDSEWRPIPITNLDPRNAISIQNEDATRSIKINHDVATVGYVGMTIFPLGGERSYDITNALVLYGRTESGTFSVNVEEIG